MPRVMATNMKKKVIAVGLTCPITVCAACGMSTSYFFLELFDHCVVLLVGPAHVNAREHPRQKDDADAERDTYRDAGCDVAGQEVLLERYKEYETEIYHELQYRKRYRY